EIVAYHEAGHAVAMHFLPNHDPVHKVTIVPRGMAGGYTMPLPDEETMLQTHAKFRDQLVGLLGGRVAEELRFGDVTTGASNDLERVSNLARAMVTQWGMSKKLGPIRYGEREELVFLGRQISEHRNYSDKIAQLIDEEVHELVEEAHQRCHTILSEHWDKMELLVNRLLEIETINAPEFEAIMRGETQPNYTDSPLKPQQPRRGTNVDENRAGEGKRTDGGLDMGGTVPAPA
ncbi:MAG: cell division protein FtsH, partial [Caldilineaceae bacterium]|nr:cell division protein FtsH [Caldilineaceae bacterium]